MLCFALRGFPLFNQYNNQSSVAPTMRLERLVKRLACGGLNPLLDIVSLPQDDLTGFVSVSSGMSLTGFGGCTFQGSWWPSLYCLTIALRRFLACLSSSLNPSILWIAQVTYSPGRFLKNFPLCFPNVVKPLFVKNCIVFGVMFLACFARAQGQLFNLVYFLDSLV